MLHLSSYLIYNWGMEAKLMKLPPGTSLLDLQSGTVADGEGLLQTRQDVVEVYSDADWAATATRKSTSGCAVAINGNVVM